jgi:hypothetical protein
MSASPPKQPDRLLNMPYFDHANLQKLAEGFASVPKKTQDLTETFLGRQYQSPIAKEYAHHGVCRRLNTLCRCIEKVYSLLPPEHEDIPPREVLVDAAVFLQAFVFNTYGVLDNLAYVWVNERNVTGRNGTPLPNGRIGLTKDKGQVRQSFSVDMRAYLHSRDPWIENLESYRHSLGHRIPLYIPPHIVDPAKADHYRHLEERMMAALLEQRDIEEHNRLQAEQEALMRFRPLMKHSFNDPTPPIVFHAQVLVDFATVGEMCERVLAELSR